ncbi:MAG TPA: superoxide dismutase family protein, partial [Oleiagrimonas sp.]|nr:superoxide dismutase family protein [Oleiagrimonas sp.]
HDIELGTGSDTDVLGGAIIVHAKPDDYTSQPSGAAGARIACGVITAD